MAQIIGIPLVEKGRVGDFTFYQRDNAVLVRSRHNEPHRQRQLSETQLRQCARMGNCINLWHAFPREHRPAFEQRRRGVTDFNRFVTHALRAHPVYLGRDMVRSGACVLSDVVVSQGSLAEIAVRHDGTAPTTDIWLGRLTIDDETTVHQLAKAVVENNFDFRHGDRLRFYLGRQRRNRASGLPVVSIECCEVVLDLADYSPLFLVVGDCPGIAVREGWLAARHEVEGGMAWVHLRQNAEGTLLSTQRLVCHNAMMAAYGSEEAFAEACRSYGR